MIFAARFFLVLFVFCGLFYADFQDVVVDRDFNVALVDARYVGFHLKLVVLLQDNRKYIKKLDVEDGTFR